MVLFFFLHLIIILPTNLFFYSLLVYRILQNNTTYHSSTPLDLQQHVPSQKRRLTCTHLSHHPYTLPQPTNSPPKKCSYAPFPIPYKQKFKSLCIHLHFTPLPLHLPFLHPHPFLRLNLPLSNSQLLQVPHHLSIPLQQVLLIL